MILSFINKLKSCNCGHITIVEEEQKHFIDNNVYKRTR